MHKVSAPILILLGAFAVGSALSAPLTQITALPYTIVKPGNYKLVTTVYSSVPTVAAITINVNLPGKVVLDLGGVITLLPDVVLPTGVPYDGIDVVAGQDVTIENGDIATGSSYFRNDIAVNPNGQSLLSNVKINNIAFGFDGNANILFNGVNSSTVSNCSFNFVWGYGIEDLGSTTGNTYKNNQFSYIGNNPQAIAVRPRGGSLTCHFTVDPYP
jgi:hypothetical protein